MIVIAHQEPARRAGGWQDGFLRMLPTIERHARFALRHLRGDTKDDALREVLASACCAYRRLYARNELKRAFAGPLARHAVSAYFRGRRVGTKQVTRDVFFAQRRREVELYSLGTPAEPQAPWRECLVDNRQTPVWEQVHFRVEFPRWLDTRSPRHRRIAERLMRGDSTAEVARRFGVSAGRISQLRREFYASWREFCGESTSGTFCITRVT